MALFSYINAVDSSGMSAGSEASNMRSYNLADPILMRAWRSLVTTSHFLSAFAAESPIDILALGGATLGPADSIRHRLYDAGGIVVLDVTVDAGVIDGYGIHFYKLASPINASRWRCDITATSRAAAGYFDIGRAWAGPAFAPSIGMSLGWRNGWVDTSSASRARYSGVTFPGAGAQLRVVEFSLDYMDETDKALAEEMARICGTRNQVFFTPFEDDATWAREAIIGKFVSPDLIAQPLKTTPPTYSQKFRIEQDR